MELKCMSKCVKLLGFDHGEDYPPEFHGSGCIVRYKDKLYVICCKHTFHLNGDVTKYKIEDYDSLCFIFDNGELSKPCWTRINFTCTQGGERQISMEDVMIYEIQDADWQHYNDFLENAANLDCSTIGNELNKRGCQAYAIGYPNRPGGHVDEEKKIINERVVGRYVQNIQRTDDHSLKAIMDTSDFGDSFEEDCKYLINGMSGGGVFTIGADGSPILVGMIYAGTASSKTIHFISSAWIAFALDEYARQTAAGNVKDDSPSGDK